MKCKKSLGNGFAIRKLYWSHLQPMGSKLKPKFRKRLFVCIKRCDSSIRCYDAVRMVLYFITFWFMWLLSKLSHAAAYPAFPWYWVPTGRQHIICPFFSPNFTYSQCDKILTLRVFCEYPSLMCQCIIEILLFSY